MIEAYDGVMDPFDHLSTFVDLTRLYATLDIVICYYFLPILKRERPKTG